MIVLNFWDFASTAAILLFALAALFIVLLALPQSRLRQVLFRMISWINGLIAVLLGISVVSPIDAIPDVVPVLGQADDVMAIAGAIGAAIVSAIAARAARQPRLSAPYDGDD